MTIERISEERDVTNSSTTLQSNEKVRLEEEEKERLEAIGRTVVTLFSLLNHAPPPPLKNVVVVQEQAPIKETPSVISETVPSQDDPVVVYTPATEEIAQNQTPPAAPQTLLPTEEKVESTIDPSPLTPEQIHQMIQLYVEQIRFYTDVATRERKLLASEEKIRFLQQLNSQQLASALNKKSDAKMQREQVIAEYEKEIEQAQQKIIELERLTQKPAH